MSQHRQMRHRQIQHRSGRRERPEQDLRPWRPTALLVTFDVVAEDSCPLCGSPVALGEDTTLRVRHLQPADERGLSDLYRRLTVADLQRRFFSGGVPPDSFLRRWVSLSASGGRSLAAELVTEGESTLVAEAGYSPLKDGDAELGITVDPSSRGWLGPWLLDILLNHAKAQGFNNLQAVVRTDNRAMMAMVKKRGFAVLGHPEIGLVRVTMSTSGRVPSWPNHKLRPRVLIESNRSRWIGEDQLDDAGIDFALCQGPCGPFQHCPVLSDEPCPLVEGADAVIVDIPVDDPRATELVEHEPIVHPDVALIAGYTPTDDGESARNPMREILEEVERHVDTD